MSKQLILIDTDLSKAGFQSVCPMDAGPIEGLQSLENYIVALEGGSQSADVTAKVGAISATATFTFTSTGPTNGQTASLLNTTLTAVTSNANPALGQFNISATPATVAASMVLAINAVLGTKVVATSALGVVTVTAKIPGVMGNGLQISAGTLSNTSAGAWANGSDGTEYVLDSK